MYAKLTAFAVSSFIVGVAGALWAFVYLGAWEPAAFSVDRSFRLLFMVIIGGLGSIMGSFFGAAFIVVLPILLNQFLPALGRWSASTSSTAGVSHAELMIFGALIVLFLIVEPHGLAQAVVHRQAEAAALALPALNHSISHAPRVHSQGDKHETQIRLAGRWPWPLPSLRPSPA